LSDSTDETKVNDVNDTIHVTNAMDANEPIGYTLKNNYLFIALMNDSEYALKKLVCSLLGYPQSDIKKLTIRNPIQVGKAIERKGFVLDVALLLNDDTYINIELQLIDYGNWPERSVGYLCRSYDNLNRGDDYIDTKPAIHIGILDFTLFEEYPEFFASYRLLNVKNHNEYTSKFQLYVLDLNQIELATQEDRKHERDVWARLFQAKTRGDLMSIAQQYKEFEPVINKMNALMSDDAIQLQYDAEETLRNREKGIRKKIHRLEEELADKDERLLNQEARIAELEAKLEELQK
jgi:predicted transposase/invertase (TIGR01784 family)